MIIRNTSPIPFSPKVIYSSLLYNRKLELTWLKKRSVKMHQENKSYAPSFFLPDPLLFPLWFFHILFNYAPSTSLILSSLPLSDLKGYSLDSMEQREEKEYHSLSIIFLTKPVTGLILPDGISLHKSVKEKKIIIVTIIIV